MVKVRIYNSGEKLVFEGSYEEYQEEVRNNRVNDSDRIQLIEEK